MTTTRPTPSAADVDAARLLLERLGVSPADLVAAHQERAPAPTFAEYVPIVRAAVGAGSRRVYGSYWNRITEHWGARLDQEEHHLEFRPDPTTHRLSAAERRNRWTAASSTTAASTSSASIRLPGGVLPFLRGTAPRHPERCSARSMRRRGPPDILNVGSSHTSVQRVS